MLFPDLHGQRRAQLNLDEESARWLERHPDDRSADGRSPFLDPDWCARTLAAIHRARAVDWSYGGYLEDRRRLWAGSYLDRTGAYLHLGVDFNVPPGTRVASPWPAQVMLMDDDGDLDGGWGLRLIVKPDLPDGRRLVVICAHIREVRARVGQRLAPGDTLAEVGAAPANGNWYPHLHLQAMREEDFLGALADRFKELDGYGLPCDLETLRQLFPDPLSLGRLM